MTNVKQMVLVSACTSIMIALIIFVAASVWAAPTQAPPGGNPAFPLQGTPGPQGAQGPAGSGAIMDCTSNSAAINPGGVQLSCPGGYWATGGGITVNSSPITYIESKGLGGGTWWCNAAPASGTCYVTCCR